MTQQRPKTGLEELKAARRESRPYFWFVGIFSFFVNLLMLTGPLYMLQVYDRVLGSRSVGTLIALYLVAQMIGWVVFLASGAPALPALFEVTSALSTVGLSQGLTGPDTAAHLKGTLIVLMLLGRLEFIALIMLFLPGTWWKRS